MMPTLLRNQKTQLPYQSPPENKQPTKHLTLGGFCAAPDALSRHQAHNVSNAASDGAFEG